MIASIIIIFGFMLIITFKNINNTFSWVFAAMFASLNIILISIIFYIIKLSNYYRIFEIENSIFMMLTRLNVNFFSVRAFINIGVALFMASKFCLIGICGLKRHGEKRMYVIYAILCLAFELLYIYLNSFYVVQNLFFFKNSGIEWQIKFSRIAIRSIRCYNNTMLGISCLLPYITILYLYKNTSLAFKRKQMRILLVVLVIVDIFFLSTFIFGMFKGKVFNNIELELLTTYDVEYASKIFAYYPIPIIIVLNIVYMFLVKYRVLDSVSFFRNRIILKKTKLLPADIRNMNHSYKNSVFAIKALGDEIREYYSDDKRLNNIVNQIDAISDGILGQLTAFANLTNNNFNNISEIDIHVCIDDAVSRLSCKGIEIEKSYNPTPIYIYAERVQIVEAIYNILANSVDAINAAEREHGVIKISVYTDIDWVCISVRDNGCGIKRKDIKKIYNPLFSTKKTNKNWGIGLSYSYKVIKAHLGMIFCESVFGEYTEFQILLPCKYSDKYTIW